MHTHITFRHLDSSDALREHAEKKVKKFEKFLHEPIEIHLVFSVQKKIHHCAEITINAKNFTFHGVEDASDMHASLDLLIAKVERHLVKHKEKVKEHKAIPTHEAASILSESEI